MTISHNTICLIKQMENSYSPGRLVLTKVYEPQAFLLASG